MGYKLGYRILVLPNQVLLINSVLTNEVLLYMFKILEYNNYYIFIVSFNKYCEYIFIRGIK